jgi:hypothetical protein
MAHPHPLAGLVHHPLHPLGAQHHHHTGRQRVNRPTHPVCTLCLLRGLLEGRSREMLMPQASVIFFYSSPNEGDQYPWHVNT